jgi:ribosomal protein S18 acetylase RimI-like enzyme
MEDTMTLQDAVHKALLIVAENVAKHIIQRDGWHSEDQCFQVDLREAEQLILDMILMNRIGNDTDYLDWRPGMGRTVEIFDIQVGSQRRHGIGRQMIKELKVTLLATDQPPSVIYAITRFSNTVAQEFYEALGFRIAGRLHNFYRDTGKKEHGIVYAYDLHNELKVE